MPNKATYPFDGGRISHFKAPTTKDLGGVGTLTFFSKDNSMAAPQNRFSKIGEDYVEIRLPLFTASEANGGVKKAIKRNGKTKYKTEHWSERSARHKRQKHAVAFMLRPHRHLLRLPCSISLTRFAPRKLDPFDNLPMSFKYILDAICEIITGDYRPGRADSYEGINSVSYNQVISKEYAVLIKITNL